MHVCDCLPYRDSAVEAADTDIDSEHATFLVRRGEATGVNIALRS
jgi:hypothetical protein